MVKWPFSSLRSASVAAYTSRNVFKLVWYRWVAQCSCTTSKKWPPAHIHVYIITVSQPTFCSCCFVSSPPWSYLPVILLLSHLPTVITYLGEWYLGLSHLYTRSTAHIFPSPPPNVTMLSSCAMVACVRGSHIKRCRSAGSFHQMLWPSLTHGHHRIAVQ